MRPIRSLFVFAAGVTAATPRGRAAVKSAVGAVRKARAKHATWHEVPAPGSFRGRGGAAGERELALRRDLSGRSNARPGFLCGRQAFLPRLGGTPVGALDSSSGV